MERGEGGPDLEPQIRHYDVGLARDPPLRAFVRRHETEAAPAASATRCGGDEDEELARFG